MKLSQFDFSLPKELIAQEPIFPRDQSRLLVLERKTKNLQEAIFKEISKFINKNDLLILNNTRVLPARLTAQRKSGGRLEILLLQEKGPGSWEVLVRPGKKACLGEKIFFADGRFSALIQDKTPFGGRLVRFNPPDIRILINQYGKMPIPQYIKKELANPDYYQTVYAHKEGAVAAPTAGFHFTKRLLDELISCRVEIAYITLHCGLATFRPIKTADVRNHKMEAEFYEIDAQAAEMINKAKAMGKRIIAVGTTTARAIEAAATGNPEGNFTIEPKKEQTNLYIYPGYRFKTVDALLTNFHLPHSTNLIMVCAFAGTDFVRQAYQYAIKKRFRFYSFGDATLII
ncbi:MAG: tRNA preQ1(34) S-adenosylmethionine ribosyltransferase-isomerase QueA [Candidatus Omnitrophota bacterium]|jgi:S-adenosylmethionine:tRNA ribosyltransferase-isomerase